MANSVMTITIVGADEPAQTVADRFVGSALHPRRSIELLRDYLERFASGLAFGKVLVYVDQGDGTASSNAAIACTEASVSDADTVTVCGVVFTAKTSPDTSDASLGQFAIGNSNTACGANLATAINAHPALSGLLTGLSTSGTVALTAANKGIHGNLFRLATSNGTGFGLTQASNGAKGTTQSHIRAFVRGG